MRTRTDIACGVHFALSEFGWDIDRSLAILKSAFRYMDLKASVRHEFGDGKGFIVTGKDKDQAGAFIDAVRSRAKWEERFNQEVEEIERCLDKFKKNQRGNSPLWNALRSFFRSILNL